MSHAPLKLAAIGALLAALASPLLAAPPPIVVPGDYPTIQAAIDAAKPGRTIQVLPGTYDEQISINKNLAIVGAGMDVTILRAPAILAPNTLGSPSLVEVYGGASVSMSQITVSGPGAGACGESGLLRWGIRVHSLGHLDFSYGAVREIHNTPMALCPRTGSAIVVGDSVPGRPPASASFDHSEITNYQNVALLALGAGTWANVTHSTVIGPGHAGGVPTTGIELVAGAAGIIAHNTVSGNVCPEGFPEVCGPDFFTQVQEAGISAGGNGPGTVIAHNRLVGNQIGLFLAEVDAISQNVMVDNEYYGLALVGVDTGQFTVDGGDITGGYGGLWVTAILTDMTVRLNKVDFSGQSGPAVDVLEDGGFHGTVIGGP